MYLVEKSSIRSLKLQYPTLWLFNVLHRSLHFFCFVERERDETKKRLHAANVITLLDRPGHVVCKSIQADAHNGGILIRSPKCLRSVDRVKMKKVHYIHRSTRAKKRERPIVEFPRESTNYIRTVYAASTFRYNKIIRSNIIIILRAISEKLDYDDNRDATTTSGLVCELRAAARVYISSEKGSRSNYKEYERGKRDERSETRLIENYLGSNIKLCYKECHEKFDTFKGVVSEKLKQIIRDRVCSEIQDDIYFNNEHFHITPTASR
ncbi:unnamed protein product [Trichogramma brassicae]|uniref:Uncharacterized protein n=1 Tax=Trichogramma brassicae TaxID=86971 RepID=A0A6H5I8A8_9HYME|nr:unnamed protein product [Trichogramma brassicae]